MAVSKEFRHNLNVQLPEDPFEELADVEVEIVHCRFISSGSEKSKEQAHKRNFGRRFSEWSQRRECST